MTTANQNIGQDIGQNIWFGHPLVAGKKPIKKNLFEEVIHATGTLELVPVFPYLDDGAIVPCLSVSIGGPNAQKFQFFHDNVVPEVALCLAGEDSALRTGQLMVLPNMHGVNNFLKDLANENAYMVVLITIRMNAHDSQDEGFLIRCEKCNELVYQRETNIKHGPPRPFTPNSTHLDFMLMRLTSSTPQIGRVQSVAMSRSCFLPSRSGGDVTRSRSRLPIGLGSSRTAHRKRKVGSCYET